MSLSIDQLRSAFKQTDNSDRTSSNYYRFWDMKVGEQATVRFLPDADESNPLGFMVEKLMHNLNINGETKNVPCRKMYGESDCPICKVSAAYYKAEDKLNGKKYWRKKQHLVQALIVEDPLPADAETGENQEGQVRILALGFQIYNIIKEAFESGELDEIPYAYEDGCNFIIKKTKQGEYDTYAVGSKFARKSSSLTEDEIAQVEENLTNLSTLLPAKPEFEKVATMLEADLTGNSYVADDNADDKPADDKPADDKPADDKPADDKPTAKQTEKVEKPATKKQAVKEAVAEVEETVEDAPGEDEFDDAAADIIAKIKNRRAAAE